MPSKIQSISSKSISGRTHGAAFLGNNQTGKLAWLVEECGVTGLQPARGLEGAGRWLRLALVPCNRGDIGKVTLCNVSSKRSLHVRCHLNANT